MKLNLNNLELFGVTITNNKKDTPLLFDVFKQSFYLNSIQKNRLSPLYLGALSMGWFKCSVIPQQP